MSNRDIVKSINMLYNNCAQRTFCDGCILYDCDECLFNGTNTLVDIKEYLDSIIEGDENID